MAKLRFSALKFMGFGVFVNREIELDISCQVQMYIIDICIQSIC